MTEASAPDINSDATERLIVAAQALYSLNGAEAVSGTVVHAGRVKETLLLECDGPPQGGAELWIVCRYRGDQAGQAACERAARGLDAAAQAGLGPDRLISGRPSPCCQQSGFWWTGYRYLDGPMAWDQRPLPVIYYDLGTFAAQWHRRTPLTGTEAPLAERLPLLVEQPEDVRHALALLAEAGPEVLLHGDINASNLVRCPAGAVLRAIDFDDVGRGPALLDLALTLGYVNTTPEDLRACCDSLLTGYHTAGGQVSRAQVIAFAPSVPWYMAACQRQTAHLHPSLTLQGDGVSPVSLHLAAVQAQRMREALGA